MAINPLLGYDPGLTNVNGIQTKEQWIAATAQSLTAEFAYADGSIATSPLLSASVWQAAGIPLPPQNLIGALAKNPNNQLPGSIYSSMYQIASWAYDHPNAVPGISVPSLPSGGPLLSDADKSNIAAATNAEANRRENAAENAANNQTAIDVANINNAGANARDAADNAAALQRAQLQAQVDRESIASNERIAAANNASRESIANADRAEQGREFDLNLAEDRRQFNTTTLTTLLQTGVDLAKNPTDWLGLQFFLQNMSVPLTGLNLSTAAIVNGAIPPTGPSEAGPVTGGPAAIDGDTTLAQMAGVQAAFVPVAQAVEQNPGTGSPAGGDAQALSARANYQRAAAQVGGEQQLERAVAQGRTTVAQAVGQNPVTVQGQQLSQQVLSQAPQTLQSTNEFRFDSPVDPNAAPGSLASMTPEQRAAATAPWRRALLDSNAAASPFGAASPYTTTNGAALPPGATVLPSGDSLANPGYTTLQPLAATTAQGAATNPLVTSAPPAATPNNTGDTQNTGIYTGNQTSNASANTSPYGNAAILDAIAQNLGVSPAEIAQLIPANLLPQAATQEQLAASPVIQSLQTGGANGFSQYRTAPADGSKFASLQAFGIPLGNFRGGQDYNAQTFLSSNPSTQAQLQGAVNATGQYYPDFQKQLFQSSPLTNYDTGAFGKRVF